MKPSATLRFALDDRIQNAEVGLAHVPLNLLGRFQKDVSDFLTGSEKEVDPNDVIIMIQDGSLEFVATGLLAATSLWADVERLRDPASLDLIDPKRAHVVERWQASARKHPHRRYTLADKGGATFVRVDRDSDYREGKTAMWVPVEKYLQGQITDMGGTSKPNVHLRLKDGQVLTIASSQQRLADEKRNRLYKPAVLRVTAEENLHSGELRNLALLDFEDPQATLDEAAFEELVRKGTQAWADVPDNWLENLRGGEG